MSETPGWASPGWTAAQPTPPAQPGPGFEPGPDDQPGQPGRPGQTGQPAWTTRWAGPPVAQPGVVPLRPLAVGELLDGAVTTIRRYPRVTLGFATVSAVLGQGITLAASAASGQLGRRLPLRGSPFAGLSALTSASAVLGVLVSSLFDLLLTGFIAVVISEAVLGRAIGARAVWTRLRPLLFPLLVIAALVAVVPLLGLTLLGAAPVAGGLLLVAPGVFLWGAWALAVPALVLERTGVRGALTRSWRLAVPSWGRVWLIRSLSWLLATVLSSVVGAAFGAVALVSVFRSALAGSETVSVSPLGLTLAAIGGVAASILTGPFLAGVMTLLYIDRRMRSEALDVALQESARSAAAATARPGLL